MLAEDGIICGSCAMALFQRPCAASHSSAGLSVLCRALWVNPPPRLRRRRGASLTAPLPLHAITPQLFLKACRYSVPGEGKDENLSYYRPEESAVEALLGRRYGV